MDKIRIGTRGSKLALWQAEHIAARLEQGGLDTEIVKIETKGDKILDVSIAKIGSKGVFTEEIEAQLADNQIDIAVHSAKDMQSELPTGFELIAFTEREVVNDVLVSRDTSHNLDSKGIKVGTSSTRRVALLQHYHPNIEVVPMRGNLQTRIRKMDDGDCDALILAYAGVHRMGYEDMIAQRLSTEAFIPAVGQGSIAIECNVHLDQEKKEAIRKLINHDTTEQALTAERAYLRTLQGGCSVPIFALASVKDDRVTITGGIISLDGSTLVTKSAEGLAAQAVEVGEQLAEVVLTDRGREVLDEIKATLS
ncbi:MAG: hydroxymethylbilane synthase [Bacteroidota bacterium]